MRFPVHLLSWCVLGLILALSAAVHADPAGQTDYSGHYELAAGAKASRTFTLDVTQKPKQSEAKISFSAAMSDGSGSAPDGDGKGEVEDGVLNFKFKDSFNNEGTATLTEKKGKYLLSLTLTKVVDPGPLHFYGNMALVRK
jgi:hypothetical protein